MTTTAVDAAAATPSARSEWRAWPVVLGAGFGMATALQLYAYSSSLIMPHLTEEFGWTRGQISAVAGLSGLGALLHPLIGRLVDRLGVRPVVFACTLLLSAVFLGIAAMPASLTIFFLLSLSKTIVAGGTNGIPHTRAIASWFQRNRGLALSLALTILPIVAAIWVPIFQKVLAAYGWRTGLVVLAGVTSLIGLPVMFLTLRERRAVKEAEEAGDDGPRPALSGFTAKEGLRKPQFWLMVGGMILLNMPGGGIMLHIGPMIGEHGFTPETVALLISIYPLSIIFGRLAGGLCLDRLPPNIVAAALSVLPAIGYGAFMVSGSDMTFALAATAVCLMGVQQGAEFDLLAFFVARHLGLKAYGFLYAIGAMINTFATSAGLFVFGWAHDLTGSYQPVLLAATMTFPAAALCFLSLGRFRPVHFHHA
jgi:predicted MFS family arabinose efflux permease